MSAASLLRTHTIVKGGWPDAPDRYDAFRPVPVMSMNFGSGERRRKKNPGFAAAIGLCAAAVALVAAATFINTRSTDGKSFISGYTSGTTTTTADSAQWLGVEDSGQEIFLDEPEQTAPVIEITQETAAPEVQDVTSVGQDQPEVDNAAVQQTEKTDAVTLNVEDEVVAVTASVSWRMPIDGGVVKQYSGDELVYCATMCDWRVHQGVDISGAADCEVRAAADGVVVDFVEDVLYGYTAIIRQADDSMLYYCGLTSVPMVSAGLEVHAGDVIGHLGTVPCEAADEPHLHLALMKDGIFADPIKVMGL